MFSDDGTLDKTEHLGGTPWGVYASGISLHTEYGASAPARVHAAEFDQADSTLYLIEANTVYEFSVSGTTPNNLAYSFLGTFVFNENSAANPFSASLSSPLSAPPTYPHALCILSDAVLAFAGEYLYKYDRTSQHWTQEGLSTCR